MKYYFDTEFHEYKKQPKVCGVKVCKPIDTIELISIGIVSEDTIEAVPTHIDKLTLEESHIKERVASREYYAICKDFNIKAAWNSFQWKTEMRDVGLTKAKIKDYWLRENVLKPIWIELHEKELASNWRKNQLCIPSDIGAKDHFCYKSFKRLINKYGKTRKQIAEEIKDFISEKDKLSNCVDMQYGFTREARNTFDGRMNCVKYNWGEPKFYAYYADYDWICFCWLFGRMIDLPDGFPMYCNDLKQIMDEKAVEYFSREDAKPYLNDPIEEKLRLIKNFSDYPKQTNEHNSISDAKWNKKLHEFLNKI